MYYSKGYSAKEVLFTFLGALNSGGKKVVAGVTYVGERAVAAVHATGELAVDVGKGAYQFGRELGDYMYTGDATILKQMPGNMVEGIKDNFKTTFNMENFKNYLDPNTSYTELKDYSKSTIQTGLTIYGGAKIVQSTINLGTNLYHGVQVNKFIHKNVPYAQQPDVKAAFGSNAKVTTLKHNTNVYRYHGGTSASKSNWVTPNQTINPVNDLALPPTNPGTSMSNYIIPKGTTVIQGSAAPNFGQLGGGAQFYVPNSMLKFLK